jgi:single-strand DNA-binding protein
MSDLNKWIGIGRLTKDPELRYTQGGTSVCSFAIASNNTYVKDGSKVEKVSYFNLVAWGKTGETIAEYVKKGHRIGLEGRLQQRSWDGEDGKKRYAIDIVVEKFQFLQAQNGNQVSQQAGPGAVAGGKEVNNSPGVTDNNPFSDEDIPF